MTKSRSINKQVIPRYGEYARIGYTPTGTGVQLGTMEFNGFESLNSQGHWWPPPKGFPAGNFGGDYSVRRIKTTVTPARVQMTRWIGTEGPTTNNTHFEGYLVPTGAPNSAYGPANLPGLVSGPTMVGKGIEGWAKYKPTASRGGLDQAIGEAHQVPSVSVVKQLREAMLNVKHNVGWHRALSKAVGRNYLNYVFGWVPLINDIRDVVENSLKLEARVRQLMRDNDKPVRRSGPVGRIESSTSSTGTDIYGGSAFPALGLGSYDGPLRWTHDVSDTTDFYFSARFRYHIVDPRRYVGGPLTDVKPREAYQLQRILYGAEITPATLYNIMPWSWLIDWICPIGDMLSNSLNDPVDNLVADYAYISAHRKITTTDTVKGVTRGGGAFQTSFTTLSETKQRTGASPYGFGLSWTGFSLKQLAILAAVGITRTR